MRSIFYLLVISSVFIFNTCTAEISVQQLEKFYVEYNKHEKTCCSKIFYAIQNEYVEIAIYLIQKNSLEEINKSCAEGTASTAAIKNRQSNIIDLLLERGADANALNGYPLKLAIWQHDFALVKILIQNGALPNPPFQEACRIGHVDIVETLLFAGADPTLGVHEACYRGHFHLVQVLYTMVRIPIKEK